MAVSRSAHTAAPAASDRWTIDHARRTYAIHRWGGGYYEINRAGHVAVHPDHDPLRGIDLKELVDDLAARGLRPPLLVRFPGILRDRLRRIAGAFDRAIHRHGYRGGYRGVYPIKVNQQRHVVEEVCAFGAAHGFGLEAGSKPELLAVLAMARDDDTPIICNGFKDDAYLESVVLAWKLGRNAIPVIERYAELARLLSRAERHGVRPVLGLRIKLASRMASRWEHPRGAAGKFGLGIGEVIEATRELGRRGMLDCLRLVHAHPGSQISDLASVGDLATELARVYVELRRAGAAIEYLDVGGGLGIDYSGAGRDRAESMNYTLDQYAERIVERVKAVCEDAAPPPSPPLPSPPPRSPASCADHPTLLSESGRAMIGYHSVLILDVLSVSTAGPVFDAEANGSYGPGDAGLESGAHHPEGGDDEAKEVAELRGCHRWFTASNHAATLRAAEAAYLAALDRFRSGRLSLEACGAAETLFHEIRDRSRRLADEDAAAADRPLDTDERGAETYLCNFSVFQSLPDSWAIGQCFPIMPIHRLDERPTRRGVLADLTCDSDGRIDRFIHSGGDTPAHALELHDPGDGPYRLGVFLVGAYQEILGDLHNLLGDTHAVHASLDTEGRAAVDHVIPGDRIRDVLGYVQFDGDDLLARLRGAAETATEAGRLTEEDARRLMRFYERQFEGYTYLNHAGSDEGPDRSENEPRS